jgi:predicted P-loop ATPase
MADLFTNAPERHNGHKVIVATYDYTDLQGTVVHQTVRYNTKDFKQRRPNPAQPGAWVWNLKGVRTVLYRLPELVAAVQAGETIYLPEGEKDVDNLRRLELAASTNPQGAGKWRKPYNQWLQGAHVVILPDCDDAGRWHAEQVARHLHGIAASVKVVALPGLPEKGDVSDWLATGGTREALEHLVQTTPLWEPTPHHPPPDTLPSWQDALTRTKGGDPKETFANLVVALEHLAPWATQCWYDTVRELPMCGTEVLSDAMVGRAAIDLERRGGIAIRNLRLVLAALVQHCRARPRDLLQEWLASLPAWDGVERLTSWLHDHAGAPKTAYGMDISRLLPVSMVARATHPGCQYRNVIIFEGDEDLGKSKLVKAVASPVWYRELSLGLEGKEAHMIVQGVWLSEFAELSSLGRTGTARLKSFITMETDDYIPKFANTPVSRPRRTIFVGTVNPEGDGTYLPGQTGNTRFLPICVTDIHIDDVLAIREQLFAEALVYYRDHPNDWWQLSSDGQTEAAQEREARRQGSVYEDSLRDWLQRKEYTTWEEIAQHYLLLEAKEKWKDKGLQMEVAKALHALRWRKGQQRVNGKNTKVWHPMPPATTSG